MTRLWRGLLSPHQTSVCREAKIPRPATPYVGFLFRCYSDPDYEPLTQRGARVHATRQAKALFAEMRERLELARDAWAEAREEGHGHVSAGLAALRAAAGRQAKELDPDEIKQRLARIAGHDLGADEPSHEVGANAIRDRLN